MVTIDDVHDLRIFCPSCGKEITNDEDREWFKDFLKPPLQECSDCRNMIESKWKILDEIISSAEGWIQKRGN